MAWNPNAPAVTERVQLETIDAGVNVKRWRAGERLAYQDRTLAEATRMSITEDGAKIRRVIPSALAYIALSLTITSADGELEGFDASDRQHVDALPEEVLDELLGVCNRVNPPTPTKRPQDHRSKAEADGEGDVEDPSRVQPTAPLVEVPAEA